MKYRVKRLYFQTLSEEWEVEATSPESAEAKVIVAAGGGDYDRDDCKCVLEDHFGTESGHPDEYTVTPWETEAA